MIEILAGRMLGGRFRIDGELGRGAMGVVYSGVQVSLARAVAIKVLRRELSSDASMVARFRAEAEQASRLAHPNIVEILDFGHEPDGLLWIAMERLEGESLGTRLARVKSMSEADTCRIAIEVLAALGAAHEHRVVHRDLKPDNIFLARMPGGGERAKLVDFGIAKLQDAEALGKLTATGAVVGTPYYMSPEQARGTNVDGRTDIYALGAMMFEMLSGRPPLVAETYTSLLVAILTDEPPPIASLRPTIDGHVANAVHRALKKNRDERFVSAQQMSDVLKSIGGLSSQHNHAPSAFAQTAYSVPAPAQPPAPANAISTHGSPASTTRVRSPLLIAAIASIATLAIGAGALSIFMATKRPTPRAPTAPTLVPTTRPSPAASAAAPAAPAPLISPDKPTVARAAPQSAEREPPAQGRPSRRDRARAHDRHEESATSTGSAARGLAPGEYAMGSVSLSGGTFGNAGPSAEATLSAIRWASCWPAGHPARTQAYGREFTLEVSPSGEVTGVSYAPDEEPAAFMRCAAQRFRTANLGPTRNGRPAHIEVYLRVEPRW
ncbi:MAG: serine/threonine protein kinase [Sandaracinaceae bacterium]|nr:serine/threonine protein kinase [Sandaracinaceae bacterium]